jgi:hypothetical protein
MNSAALFRAANLIVMDYPFPAALASALSICDEAVVVVGQSVDETLDLVYSLQDKHGKDRVRVIRAIFHYDRMWQERWWNLASACTDAEWLMYHDADEAIHEDDAPKIRQLMAHPRVHLIRFPFIHFYATRDYEINFTLRHNTRLGRRSIGYRMKNLCSDENPTHAACAMRVEVEGIDYNAHTYMWNELVNVSAPIYHYGWARNAQALAKSQAKYWAWYADGDGLEGGQVPDVETWPLARDLPRFLKSGRVNLYDGKHPKVMQEWFDQHAKEWECITQ